MKRIATLNFLHYGDALKHLLSADLSDHDGILEKTELLSHMRRNCLTNQYITSIVSNYDGKASRILDMDRFRSDIIFSAKARKSFAALGCRGFSYKFCSGLTGFPYRLRSRINLRMALVADSTLYYPSRISAYLSRHRANHYFENGSPAIAFALGISSSRAWNILVLQSDVVRYGPSSVRDHFRGWRKVLFANILNSVICTQTSVHQLMLSTEKDALRGCHVDFPMAEAPPSSWACIYSSTAKFFGMKLKQLPGGLNIQLYDRQPAVITKQMFALDIRRLPRNVRRIFVGGTA